MHLLEKLKILIPPIVKNIVLIIVIFTVISTSIIILLTLWIQIANSDLRGRNRSQILLSQDTNKEVEAILILHRLIPRENSAEVSLGLCIKQGNAYNLVLKNKLELSAILNTDLIEGSGIKWLKTVTTNDIDSTYRDRLEIISNKFRIPLYLSVIEFPFDSYTSFLGFRVESQPNVLYDANYVVIKEFPGWVISTEYTHLDLRLKIERPGVQKVIVVLSAFLFLLVSGLVLYAISKSPTELRGIADATALAGFVLALVGFREMIGLADLPSASWLELILLTIPFMTLIISIGSFLIRKVNI